MQKIEKRLVIFAFTQGTVWNQGAAGIGMAEEAKFATVAGHQKCQQIQIHGPVQEIDVRLHGEMMKD